MAKEQCISAAITRMQRVQLGYDSENVVSSLYNGETTAHRAPVDIVTNMYGIEVKAFHKDAIVKKCRMTDEAIARKEEWCKAHHKKGKTIMSVVNDVIELYERDGFGNFRKENMKFIAKFENPNRGKD